MDKPTNAQGDAKRDAEVLLRFMGKDNYLARGSTIEGGEFRWTIVADKISVSEILRQTASTPTVAPDQPCPTCGTNVALNDQRIRAYAEEVNGLLDVVESQKERCDEHVTHFIAGASWFPCALAKGHEGLHRGAGNCFEHGEYLGEPNRPPIYCPSCAISIPTVAGKVRGEDAWLDEIVACCKQRDKLRTVIRAFAANLAAISPKEERTP